MPEGIPLPLDDYLELVDWKSGRILREGKCGAIDERLPPILGRLQIDPQHWPCLNRNFESRFKFPGGRRALDAQRLRTARLALGAGVFGVLCFFGVLFFLLVSYSILSVLSTADGVRS